MEIEILNLIQHLRTPFLDEAMRFVTSIGNFSMAWVILALVLILIPKTRKIGLVVMVAVILDSVLCNVILKNIFLRSRPCDVNTAINPLIPRPLGYSFPSGHTSASFAAMSETRASTKSAKCEKNMCNLRIARLEKSPVSYLS